MKPIEEAAKQKRLIQLSSVIDNAIVIEGHIDRDVLEAVDNFYLSQLSDVQSSKPMDGLDYKKLEIEFAEKLKEFDKEKLMDWFISQLPNIKAEPLVNNKELPTDEEIIDIAFDFGYGYDPPKRNKQIEALHDACVFGMKKMREIMSKNLSVEVVNTEGAEFCTCVDYHSSFLEYCKRCGKKVHDHIPQNPNKVIDYDITKEE